MAEIPGTIIGGPITPGSDEVSYGTHYSFFGIGGYAEVNTITELNSIPVNDTVGKMNPDGYSSGRRRLGMLVWERSTDKFYQLRVSNWDSLATDQDKYDALASNTNWVENVSMSTNLLAEAKAYADSLVIGLLDDRGNYDVSTDTFPTTGGSGTAGALLKGDVFTAINGPGILLDSAGQPIEVNTGDLIRVLVDSPGQTGSNWAITVREDKPYSFTASNKLIKTNHTTGEIEEEENLEWVADERAIEVISDDLDVLPRINLKADTEKASLGFSHDPGWVRVVGAEANPLFNLAFIHSERGQAVGLGHIIYETQDGGYFWSPVDGRLMFGSDLTEIFDLAWIDAFNGYYLVNKGANPSLYSTTNTGATWTQKFDFSTTLDIITGSKSFKVFDVDNIYVFGIVSSNGVMRKSSDGGTTFSTAVTVTGIKDIKVSAWVDQINGVVCGNNASQQAVISITDDGGSTWSVAELYTTYATFNDCVLIGTYGIAVGRTSGNVGVYVLSDDGGQTWGSGITIPNTLTLESVNMLTTSIGFITGLNTSGQAVIYKTTDGGQTWELSATIPESGGLLASHFVSENKGIFVGVSTSGTSQGPVVVTETLGVSDSEIKAFSNGDPDNLLPLAVADPSKPSHAVSKTYADSKVPLVTSAVSLVSSSSIELTSSKHVLTTALSAIDVTISHGGDNVDLVIELNAATSVLTFLTPGYTTLCKSSGDSSGDNTCTLEGVSGDVYVVAVSRIGTRYFVLSTNMTR